MTTQTEQKDGGAAALSALRSALECAPHPRTLIGGEHFEPVAYMDWYFRTRADALAARKTEGA